MTSKYKADLGWFLKTLNAACDSALFSRRRFDYCIVDEASQITLPTCLGPLRFADKFVLVGDHYQLPPLVRCKVARNAGLDVSLFRLLSDKHSDCLVELTQQYRMNEDIMHLSNTLIYEGKLQCGSEEVAKRCLEIPNYRFIDDLHLETGNKCDRVSCWLEYLLSPRYVFFRHQSMYYEGLNGLQDQSRVRGHRQGSRS